MNGINDIVWAIMITSATGSIYMVIWLLIGRLLEQAGYLRIAYVFLKVSIFFFFFPLSYILLKYINGLNGLWGGVLFLPTDDMLNITEIIFTVWAVPAALMLLKHIVSWICLMYRTRNVFDCDKATIRIFERTCSKLGVSKGRIRLCRSYTESTPKIIGMIRPRIILPVSNYTDRELEVIFCHELHHYIHKDILFKHLTELTLCLNFFNPLVWVLRSLIEQWSEYACDDSVWKRLGNAREYCSVLLEIGQKQYQNTEISAGFLKENQKGLLSRVNIMKRTSKLLVQSKLKAAVIVAVIMMSTTTGVVAATAESAELYVDLYNKTSAINEEKLVAVSNNELEEFEESGPLKDGTIEYGELQSMVGEGYGTYASTAVKTFSWNVYFNCIKASATFKASAGQAIQISGMVTPDNGTFGIGIIEPDGTRRYVKGTSFLAHTFMLDKTGYYAIYVHNFNTTGMATITGTYRVIQ